MQSVRTPAQPAATAELAYRAITPLWLSGFLAVLLGMVLLLDWANATRKVDRLLLDSWVRLNQRAPPTDVVIVAIDPVSLTRHGRWPWPRGLQADLFARLAEYDVRAVGIDLLFVERGDAPVEDLALADAIGDLPNVVLPVLTEGQLGQTFGEKLPIPVLTRQVDDLGHIFLPIDDDGIVRRIHLRSGFRAPHWPAFALAIEQLTRDHPAGTDATVSVEVASATVPGRRIDQPLTTDEWIQDYEVLIPFFGPSGTFRSVSASAVLEGRTDPAALSGATVFVGMTATGLSDTVPTAVSALDRPMPGVEIHANVLAALRDGSLITRLEGRWNLIVAALLMPLLLVLYSRGRPAWSLFATLSGALLPVLLSYVLYRTIHVWYAPLSTSVPMLVGYFVWSWHRLDFINRFLERESQLLDPHLPHVDDDSDAALRAFFDNATRHLPIAAWSIRIAERRFDNGEPVLLTGRGDGEPLGEWMRFGDVYRKRYHSSERMQIRVRIPMAERAADILAYIDSLARVRRRAAPTHLIGSIERLQDTARALSEKTAWLRSIKVFTETVMASSPAGFAVWNPAGELLRCNSLLHDMVPGLSSKPLLLDFVEAIGRTPDSGADARQFQALMLDGKPWQLTCAENDREFIVNFNAAGQSLAERLVSVVLVDVSEIRSSERARSEMVDYLSHDLRSPLISALYLVDGDDVESLPTGERDRRIEANIRQSLSMMDELLHVARADSLSSDHFSELLFDSVLDNALDQLSPQARARGVAIEVDVAEDTHFWMVGDASSLERAVVNVLGNAIKYSHEGGHVTVRATERIDGCEQVRMPCVQLVIEDRGIGIDPEHCDQLFQRFRREKRVTENYPGVGLGLALVARVIREHHGEVFAEAVSPGTRVTIRLPLDPEA